MNECCILTGYDAKYESFAPYWLYCIRTRAKVDWKIYVCDFGFSEDHKKWLESQGVEVYKAASSQTGWFLKPFAIRDCPARFGVYIDIDAEAMLEFKAFYRWIRPGRIGVAPDPNDVFVYQVSQPLNSGVITFDNLSRAISVWCSTIECGWLEGSPDSKHWVAHVRKGDQGYLNLCVPRDVIDAIPRKLNWFDKINDLEVTPDPEAVVWHHLGPIGKQRFLKRAKEFLRD